MSTLQEEFMSNVSIRRGQDQCWQWIGKTKNGYGFMRIGGRVMSARKVAFELEGKVLHRGQVLRTTCGSMLCVNPSHLHIESKRALKSEYKRSR